MRHKSPSTLSRRPVPRRLNSARHSPSCTHARHTWPRRKRHSTNSGSPRFDAGSRLDAKQWWNAAGTGARWAKRVCAPSRESTVLVLSRMAPTVRLFGLYLTYSPASESRESAWGFRLMPSFHPNNGRLDRGKPVAPVRRVVRVLSLARCACARIPSSAAFF